MDSDNLDITVGGDLSSSQPPDKDRKDHRFLGIRFACCDVYTRIYVNRSGTAYEGRCPKCGRSVRVRIGEGGTDERFFTAY